MASNKRNPWDRNIVKGESPRAHGLFWMFIELGRIDRSPKAVAEKSGRKVETIRVLHSKFEWAKRAKAYDNYLLRIQEKVLEAQLRSDTLVWAHREAEYRHEAYGLSEALLAKAREMMAGALYIEETDKLVQVTVGGETVEVPTRITYKPVRWNFKTMVDIVDLADKIRRLSLGIPTSRTSVNVNVSDDSIEERVIKARAAMKAWRETRLEAAVQRVIESDPGQDPNQVRTKILEAAPSWFASGYNITDSSLLLPEAEVNIVPPLQLEEMQLEESAVVN